MAQEEGGPALLNFEDGIGNPFLKTCYGFLRRPLETFLEKERILRLYQEITDDCDNSAFIERVLDKLHVDIEVTEEELRHIPEKGPVIVVSNHPFGGLDGIILIRMLTAVRSDVMIMANYLLSHIPQLKERFLPVDPFGGPKSIRKNIRPVREAIRVLREGGMLCAFPSGEVAHFQWKCMKVDEPQWNSLAARLARKTRAAVLPVFFQGGNSILFHCLGLVHPKIRTAMLPREIVKKSKCTIRVAIGRPMEYAELKRFEDDEELTAYFRLKTALLNKRLGSGRKPRWNRSLKRNKTGPSPVADPADLKTLETELGHLGPSHLIVEKHPYRVFIAESIQIPFILREIGRLRELTFRSIGEGTGKPLDLDAYDTYYHHLFLWNDAEKTLVGAYRMGFSAPILEAHGGVKGFYTHSLFDFKAAFIQTIQPAIELGRSFVRPEYQKNYHPLMLLWKGIGKVVARNPSYKILFGPVSITDAYQSLSRHLMVAFIKAKGFDARLARFIRPRNAPKDAVFKEQSIKKVVAYLQDLQALSELISEIEGGHMGVPILLKQYMKLGGKILGFGLDPDFNNTLDALILVDLTRTDRKILTRYMGETEAEAFLRHHGDGGLLKCA